MLLLAGAISQETSGDGGGAAIWKGARGDGFYRRDLSRVDPGVEQPQAEIRAISQSASP